MSNETFSVTLPNGHQIDGVPMGTSKTEVMRMAVNNGLAAYADFGDPQESAAVGGMDDYWAGLGKSVVDTKRGVAQFLGADNQKVIDEAAQRDRALMNSGAGFAGNLTGTLLQAAPTFAIPGANTLTGASVLGALYGGTQPVQTGDSRMKNVGLGGLLGFGGQLLGKGVPDAFSALSAPFRASGRDKIAGRLLNRFATNADDVLSAPLPQPELAGIRHDLAQATGDPGLAKAQRVLSNDPIVSGRLREQDVLNNRVAIGAVDNIAGDTASMEAAITARKQASTPLYTAAKASKVPVDSGRTVNLIDRITSASPANKALITPLKEIRESLFESWPAADRGKAAWKALSESIEPARYANIQGSQEVRAARTVMDRVRKGSIDADEALAQLKEIPTPKIQRLADAMDLAKRHMQTPEWVLRENPGQLISAVDNIKALLGKQENAFVRRELMTIKQSLEHQIGKAAPEFGQAEAAFAQGSRPINQMQIAKALSDKLQSGLNEAADIGLARVRPESYAAALRNPDVLAKQATGFKRAKFESVMEPGQKQQLNAVRDYFSRRANAMDNAKELGSPTGANLVGQDIVRQIAGPLGAPESFMEGILSHSVAKVPTMLLGGAEQAVKNRLAEALLQPGEALKLMAAGTPSQRKLLASKLYGQMLTAGTTAGSIQSAH